MSVELECGFPKQTSLSGRFLKESQSMVEENIERLTIHTVRGIQVTWICPGPVEARKETREKNKHRELVDGATDECRWTTTHLVCEGR
jgi:hypothetical protein